MVINQANEILEEYRQNDYDLTLRQLYYQFIAKDLFPEDRRWSWTGKRWVRDPDGTKNADPNYKWLGTKTNDARLAGLMDWDTIVDRTRNLLAFQHWYNPADRIEAASYGYHVDIRSTQDYYIEVWVEKEALIGVIERTCDRHDVPCFACRGYVSQSAMWRAAVQRFVRKENDGFLTKVLYLGDHDPSGVDMPRDIQERMEMFGSSTEVDTLALTMNQIVELRPPHDPAKLTDSRCQKYIQKYGSKSWELDALEPEFIDNLITVAILELTDNEKLTVQK
ncbi:hypothetical protein KA005_69670, partial [bacterium]|nr:hypothetical protein [bacterium]